MLRTSFVLAFCLLTATYSQTLSPLTLAIPTSGSSDTYTTTITTTSINNLIPSPTPVDTASSVYGQISTNSQGVALTQMYAPNCAGYNNGVCTQCSFRFIRAADGVCEPVNPLCASWDTNGACLTCYPGYEICENGCIMSESCAPEGTYDPNCRNTVNGICQNCSQGYYFNQNGICTEISPFCRTNDGRGNCLTCYAGYALNAGSCVVAPNPADDNPYCNRWVAGVCQSCASSSYLSGNRCVAFDPMCASSNTNNGNCLTCYGGYVLSAGRCVLSTNTQPNDLLCRRWNAAGVCVECSTNAYFRQNMCVAVDALCRTFDAQNGNCLTCYSGYQLQSGRCVVVPPESGFQANNQYCAVWEGTTCRQCAANSYFDNNRICRPNNPYCATSGPQGQCLTCYSGFALRNNNCTIDNTTINVGNALCSVWAGLNCQQCSTRSYNFNGVCTAVNTLCNTWNNNNGFCLTCYNGYILNGNNCVLDNQSVSGNPLCKTFNGPLCVECANRAYFVNGICTAVNTRCASFNSANGQCTACYNGFQLTNDACVELIVSPPSNVNFDIYCARSDTAGRCIRCFYGFILQNGTCVADFKNTPCAKDPRFCKK